MSWTGVGLVISRLAGFAGFTRLVLAGVILAAPRIALGDGDEELGLSLVYELDGGKVWSNGLGLSQRGGSWLEPVQEFEVELPSGALVHAVLLYWCTVGTPDATLAIGGSTPDIFDCLAWTVAILQLEWANPDPDVDQDGYPVSDDCDDGDPLIHPGALEIDDGEDNDCDGLVDEDGGEHDWDGDGWTEANGDCDDGDPWVSPSAGENCGNGVDDDCDGLIDGKDAEDCPGVTAAEQDQDEPEDEPQQERGSEAVGQCECRITGGGQGAGPVALVVGLVVVLRSRWSRWSRRSRRSLWSRWSRHCG